MARSKHPLIEGESKDDRRRRLNRENKMARRREQGLPPDARVREWLPGETKDERKKRLARERQDRWRADPENRATEHARLARHREENPGYRHPKMLANLQIVNALKSEPCTDCGQRFHTVCMDFDHLPERGPKAENVGTMVSAGRSLESILAEIAKCELVCANCHRIRTYRRSLNHQHAAHRVQGMAQDPATVQGHDDH